MRLYLCCLFLLLGSSALFCQQTQPEERVYKYSLELRHDNDFPVFTDRYYTTGNFIGWRTKLAPGKDSTEQKQYNIFVVQQLYTPADIIETDIKKFDRPFAGFLGLSNGLTITNSRRLLDLSVLIGVSGPPSGGAAIQEAFHSAPAVSSRIPTWLGQLRTSAFGNIYGSYTREWQWEPNPFSVHFALSPSAALGNKDIYGQQEAAFFFGRRSSLQKTSAYQQIGDLEKEFFFAVRVAYRYIFHDAMQEGDFIGDSSPFLIKPHRNRFIYNFEMNGRIKRHNFMVAYNYATPENRRAFPHLYVTLSITRAF